MEFEPFYFYRTILFVALTVWTVATIVTTSIYWWRWLRGSSREKQVIRVYAQQLLLSFRLAPLREELLQIVFWILVIVALYHAHGLLDT